MASPGQTASVELVALKIDVRLLWPESDDEPVSLGGRDRGTALRCNAPRAVSG